MLFFILLLINFSVSFSQELDNCVDKEKYKYEYFYNSSMHHPGIDLKLNIFSKYDTEIIIHIPHLNYKRKIKIFKNNYFEDKLYNYNQSFYNNNLINSFPSIKRNGNYKTLNSGIYIYSNQKVICNLISECHTGSFICGHFSAFTLLSNRDSGKKYSLILPKEITSEVIFNIVSYYNDNTILYNSLNNDYKGEIKLMKGENIYIQLENSKDLNKVMINAKYPISISQDYTSYSNIIGPNRTQILLPERLIGNEYLLLPFEFENNNLISNSYYYNIIPTEDNCNIYINNTLKGNYNKNNSIFEFSDIPIYIKSDKKINIFQYNNSIMKYAMPFDASARGSFVHCPPLRSMENEINLLVLQNFDESTCNGNKYKNDKMYCNLIKKKDSEVKLDNVVLNNFTNLTNSEFSYKSFPLLKGVNELKSDSGLIAFIYGYKAKDNNSQTLGFYFYNTNDKFNRDDADILINNKSYNEFICGNSPFILSADAPEEAVTFDWTINDTLKVSGKEVNLDLTKPGKYEIKLKIDNDDSQVYEWTTTRLEEIKSDLDSVIYLCNDSLSNISMNVSGGGTSKSITWFPNENIKDPTKFNIEFIKPLKERTKLFYEIIDEHCCSYLDSVDIQITNVNPIITTTQNNFCYGDSTTLSLDKDYDSIIWNTGERTKDIIVKESGVYSATVTEGECINDTSIVINVNPLPTLDIEAPDGTILCDGGSIVLEAKVLPNTSIVWNDGTRLAKRTFNQSGTYTVTAEDLTTGCKAEKSIIVSDIENLKAEIQGDPTFCDGESTTLTIQPQGKSYLWSNGETTQSIVVNSSGLYSATITTDTDCKIDAEKEVEKLPLPSFQILGETIICNNKTTIYPDKDFKYYQWSNGEISKSITIDKAGDYDLTVTDDNGCKATQRIEITESTPEINLSNRNIDFGELLFGSTKSDVITTDRDILFIKNSSIFDVNYQNKNINISFIPKDIGEFKDTLIIESTGDCKATDTIYIKGICKAEILAKVSNSEGYPSDLVNNTVNLELLQNIPLPKDFNYEIDIQINQDAISITDATTFYYTNNKLEINIADYLNKTSYDEEVKNINSKILLAKNLENELLITNFTTDNPYLIPIRQNGNIKIYEVCLYEERLIQHYNEAIISNITQTNIKLSTYYAGKYTIEITDISGKTTTKEVTTKSDDEEINFTYNLTNGTYIIKINEPGKTQTRKIIFGE